MTPPAFSESIWPDRWRGDLQGAAERIPRTLHLYIPRVERDADGDWAVAEPARGEPFWRILACEPHGRGIVQEYRRWTAPDLPEGVEPATSDEMFRQRREEEESVRGIAARTRRLRFLQWANEPSDAQLRSDDVRDWVHHSAGMLLLPAEQRPPVLAIVTGGGSRYDWELRRHMVERGWAVLHIGLSSTMDVNPRSEFVIVGCGRESPAMAAEIADTVDQHIATEVYAAEAFVSYVRAHEAELRDVPIVLVGLSRGSFCIPALSARLDERPAAAVLVTAGADLVDIALRTTLADQRWLRIAASDGRGGLRRPTASEGRSLRDAYRALDSLDPFRTAPALHGTPTLMIHGMFDCVVPASTGDVLFERLARPERWSYPLGHAGVFWLLPQRAGRMVEWAERTMHGVD